MAKTRTAEQEAARARLLATGKYETYTDATGKTDIRLKKNIRLIQLQQLHRHSLKLAYPVILPAVLHFEA